MNLTEDAVFGSSRAGSKRTNLADGGRPVGEHEQRSVTTDNGGRRRTSQLLLNNGVGILI